MDRIIAERIEGQGGDALGRLRLNRPAALHALDRTMCEGALQAIGGWLDDVDVRAITIDHADGRGFCAGGDIRQAADLVNSAGIDAAQALFGAEYRLNHRIHTAVKPIACFMDGVTMGGGVGLAVHCRHRIATPRTIWAMPETAIGFFPDVGACWYLARLPAHIGRYLALTGARLGAADLLWLGLADHHLAEDAVEVAKDRIAADAGEMPAILTELHSDPAGPSALAPHAEAIERLFAAPTLKAILEALAGEDSDFAQETRAKLAAMAPSSCKVALRLLDHSLQHIDFADQMRLEYTIATRMVGRPDFAAGVRAALVERNGPPTWDPADADAVSDSMVDRIFAPAGADEEWEPA